MPISVSDADAELSAQELIDSYTNPNGVPDAQISETEAAMWLLSKTERRAGVKVILDPETERWRPKGVQRHGKPKGKSTGKSLKCTVCGTRFEAKRRDAKFCSAKCRVRGSRALVTDKSGHPTTGTGKRK